MTGEPIAPGRARRRFGPVLGICVLAVMAILLALGTWQVQRLHWKENLLAMIDRRIAAEPLPLDAIEAEFAASGDVEYLPVRLSGTFDHAAEQYFLATHQGRSGWYVYAPLYLEDGRALIVNRGFIPYDLKDAETAEWRQREGEVAFTALARDPLHEKPSFIVPDNNPGERIWYWKDHGAMRTAMGLEADETLPFFADIRGYDGAAPAPYPVPGVTRISLPNSHLQYAVTWYGLAAALAAVAGFMFFRRPDEDG